VSQGFPKDCRLHLPTSLCVFASGNAYPVPCIIACVHGMVAALATFDLLNWPPHDMAGVKVPANDKPFKELLTKPGRIVNKAKAKASAKAKAAQRSLKRRRSFSD
jgi:hypothetical protein